MNKPQTVIDTNGTKYSLGKELGSGGQGAVFEVEGGKYAVKLLNRVNHSDHRRIDRQFLFLKQLELDDVPIAKPISVLRQPHAGYIMPLLKGMGAISQLTSAPAGCTTALNWYKKSGGLRRRLVMLTGAAEAISALHARGLCYGDVSPTNIFISESQDSDAVWLIDADNLRYESRPTNQTVYTPGYGAPEVIEAGGITSSLSDAHSLAVLAFVTLCQTHPLIGDLVHDGDPDLEAKAFAGESPWIDHPTDASNRSSRGIPRSIVLSRGLRELANRSFLTGFRDKKVRPSASEWAEGLRLAANNCLTCDACAGTFYLGESDCPWCGKSSPSYVRMRFRTWVADTGEYLKTPNSPGKKDRMEDSFVLSGTNAMYVSALMAYGLSAKERSQRIACLSIHGSSLHIERVAADAHIELRQAAKRIRLGSEPLILPINSALSTAEFHFGPPEQNYRVMDCWPMSGAKQ